MMKLTSEEISYMKEFEKLTGVNSIDCIVLPNSVNFLVSEESMGLAIGKNGSKIKKIENLFKKKVNVYPYSKDLNNLIQKILYPLKLYKLYRDKNRISVIIDKKSIKNKKLYLDKKSLLELVLKRHFSQNVKVV